MNFQDYTGKLNTHQEYLEILDKIEPKCKYIEIVVTNTNINLNIPLTFKAIEANSPEGKLKSAEEAAEAASEAAEKAAEAYNNLSDAFENLSDKYAIMNCILRPSFDAH